MKIKEVSASLYAWDLADEGVEKCVDTLVERSNVNSVYLIGVMHHEKRPLTSLVYTHNPKRKFYIPEDSRVHYKMDLNSFSNTPLKPQFCETDFLKGTDWLDVLTDYGRKKKLKVGVELSHTIYDVRLAIKNNPEILQQYVSPKVFENSLNHLLCLNHPYVREYIRAMFEDTVKHHDLDFIQTCLLFFNTGTYVKAPWFFNQWMKTDDPKNQLASLLGLARGGCFCKECEQKAKKMGYDWELIINDMKYLNSVADATPFASQDGLMENQLTMGSDLMQCGLLLEYPGLYEFMRFRMECVTELFKDIYEAVHNANPSIELRYNNCNVYPELSGVSLKKIAPYVDSVRDSDYTEQLQTPFDNFVHKRNTILKIRRGIGFEKDIIAAIAIRPNATPELIEGAIKVLSEIGIDGLALGHYDGSYYEHLDAVKRGMINANMFIEG